MDWTSPPKPAEITENRLIDAILAGHFPISSNLPAERELASQLGVTRPTLREALQRLGRDGWIEIHQGRPTRVRDFWHEGNLGVLGAIATHTQHIPADFVPNLLQVRMILAPAYARQAIENNPFQVVEILSLASMLEDNPVELASYDWQLHYILTIASSNPVFTLILNGFRELYLPMGRIYFKSPQARSNSRTFYHDLEKATNERDALAAEELTRVVMEQSLQIWDDLKNIFPTASNGNSEI